MKLKGCRLAKRKEVFIMLITDHKQPELAESFNSITINF